MSTKVEFETDSRIVAVYPSKEQLMQAKAVLKTKLGIKEKNLEVVSPEDPKVSGRLEGSSKKIGANMLRLHAIYVTVSFIVGMLIAYALVNHGPTITQLNPFFTYLALISPSIFLGAFYAGLISLKPWHDDTNLMVVDAAEEKNWSLIVSNDSPTVSKNAIEEELNETNCIKLQTGSIKLN